MRLGLVIEKYQVAMGKGAKQTRIVSASLYTPYRCLVSIETKLPALPAWSMLKLPCRTYTLCSQAPKYSHLATRPTTLKCMSAISYLCIWTGNRVRGIECNKPNKHMSVARGSVVAVLKDLVVTPMLAGKQASRQAGHRSSRRKRSVGPSTLLGSILHYHVGLAM